LNRLRALFSHGALALGQAGIVALVILVLVAGTALAAKGGNGGGGHGGGKPGGGSTASGTLTLVMVADANGNGTANWADTITFDVTSTSTSPYVSVRCYQGGTLVYGADAGFYDSYPWPGARNMPLYSPAWTGGAADCTTSLNGSPSLSFHVDA
jgi:hypothetical protein